MRKIILLLLLTVTSLGYSQKKKTSKKTTSTSKSVLAKLDNLSAEIITDKKGKKLVLFVTNGSSKDTLELKKIESVVFNPLNFTIKSFTTNGVKLYCLNWQEKNAIETKVKKENQDIMESQIWNIESKELLIGNTQKSSHIIETVFLDKNRTASETQERNRKEGFEFVLLPNGDVNLKNKTQNNTYSFQNSSMKYVINKATASKATKKRR